ncbi:MAG: hypothetical protein AVDCRST_MAG48-2589 [uncultured Friedmanniella sp.]|uniref:Uncharacterized protein n=1 Tax=uncultured Friedmanniella sp. TaxID=335381 RepID=A0A6J4L161_9ACTN|nr:MAG: hypothetical protein AVDCRST_MAG48-2589 [uncultured Friedmanniella sp.]
MTLTADQTNNSTGSSTRQQVLALYLANSSLDSRVIAWTSWDGTGRTRPTAGDADEPPYDTGVAALLDGWRLFQVSPLLPPAPGHEFDTSFLKHEFFFEKLVG